MSQNQGVQSSLAFLRALPRDRCKFSGATLQLHHTIFRTTKNVRQGEMLVAAA